MSWGRERKSNSTFSISPDDSRPTRALGRTLPPCQSLATGFCQATRHELVGAGPMAGRKSLRPSPCPRGFLARGLHGRRPASEPLGRRTCFAGRQHLASLSPGCQRFARTLAGLTPMIALTPATRVFVALAPVDLRRSFNGLCACVQEQLRQDPVSGHLFVFTNARRTRLKILCWDGSGLWVCANRLDSHCPV